MQQHIRPALLAIAALALAHRSEAAAVPDWLVTKVSNASRVVQEEGGGFRIDNGLIYRHSDN